MAHIYYHHGGEESTGEHLGGWKRRELGCQLPSFLGTKAQQLRQRQTLCYRKRQVTLKSYCIS